MTENKRREWCEKGLPLSLFASRVLDARRALVLDPITLLNGAIKIYSPRKIVILYQLWILDTDCHEILRNLGLNLSSNSCPFQKLYVTPTQCFIWHQEPGIRRQNTRLLLLFSRPLQFLLSDKKLFSLVENVKNNLWSTDLKTYQIGIALVFFKLKLMLSLKKKKRREDEFYDKTVNAFKFLRPSWSMKYGQQLLSVSTIYNEIKIGLKRPTD